MLVHATPSDADAEKYDWDEIAMDVVDSPIINPSEVLDRFALRMGREHSGTYGTSLTDGWEGGYAICKVTKNTKGEKRYWLAPVAPPVAAPVQIMAIEEGYSPDDEPGITMNRYLCQTMVYSFQGVGGEAVQIESQFGDAGWGLNLAEYGDNIPPTDSSATVSVHPIQVGTRVLARKYPVIDISKEGQGTVTAFYLFSLMNNLRVEC